MTQLPPSAPGVPAATPTVKPHRGVMILVFGILGFVCCIIFSIVAWVMGNKDLAEMAAGRMDRSGEGLTKAGKICGIVGVALNIVFLVVTLLMWLFFSAAIFAKFSQM